MTLSRAFLNTTLRPIGLSLEQQARWTVRPLSATASAFRGQRPRALDGDLAQNRRMHHLVDEAHLQRAFRAHASPGENHVERGLQPDAARQSLRSTHSGNESELHLGKRERRLRMIGAHAIAARERQLEPAAETRAVNRATTGTRSCSSRRAYPAPSG